MNDVLKNYHNELEAAVEAAKKRIDQERKKHELDEAKGKPVGAFSPNIDLIIDEALDPITEKYQKTIEVEEILKGIRKYSQLIRSALAPEKEQTAGVVLASSVSSNSNERRTVISEYFSPRFERLVKEVEQLSLSKDALREIAGEITSLNDSDLITKLTPHFDFLVSPEFEMKNIQGVKELAFFISLADSLDEDTTIENLLTTPESLSEIARAAGVTFNFDIKANASETLLRLFKLLVPKFINRASVAEACRRAAEKVEKTHIEKTKLVKLIENRIPFLNEKNAELDAIFGEFEIEFKTKRFKKKDIKLEDQKKFFEQLIAKTSPIKNAFEAEKKENTQKIEGLTVIQDLIEEYKSKQISEEDFKKRIKRFSTILGKYGLNPETDPNQLEEKLKIEITNLFINEEMYDFLSNELDEKENEFINEWGLKPYAKEIAEKDVEDMSVEEVIREIVDKEKAYWTNLHETSPDERIRKLVYRVKYNLGGKLKGYESVGSRNGTEDDYWASLEGTRNMVWLLVYGVFAQTMHGKSYAEGDRTKLWGAIDQVKLTRERMIMGTTADPVYGRLLSKVLELSQDLPILKAGQLPPQSDWDEISKESPEIKKRLDAARVNGGKVLNDRIVLRPLPGGKFDRIFLAGDSFIEIKNEQTSHVERRTFFPGEEMLPGDKLYLEADKRFSYETLTSNDGRKQATLLHQKVMDDIIADPERYGLTETDVKIGENLHGRVQELSTYLFYAFPFLTYIFHKSQERTKTAAHGKHLHDDFDYGLVFSPAGKAIHESDRYGDFVSWMWLLVFYKELKPGMFGASGIPNRLNEFRKVLVSYLKAQFGKSIDDYVGKIDILENLMPEFTSPLKWLTLAPEECVGFKGDSANENGDRIVNAKDGTEVFGTNANPYYVGADGKKVNRSVDKKQPATTFELLHVAIKGWVELLASTVRDIPEGSVDLENLKSRGEKKGLFGEVIANITGTLKMWFTKSEQLRNTPKEKFNTMEGAAKYFVLSQLDRMFYALKPAHNPRQEFANRREALKTVVEQIEAATGIAKDFGVGGTGAGEVKEMWLWILHKIEAHHEKERYEPTIFIEDRIKMMLAGNSIDPKELGFRASFAPPEVVAGNHRQQDLLDHLNIVYDYEYGKQPEFAKIGPPMTNNPLTGFLTPQAFVLKDDPIVGMVIRELSEVATDPSKLKSPLPRVGIKTDSASSDKK